MIPAKLQPPSKAPAKRREFRGWSAPAAPSKRKPSPLFKEYSLVKARREIREGAHSVPAGAIGTIVDVVRGGEGYQVEFTEPKHLVISARPTELLHV